MAVSETRYVHEAPIAMVVLFLCMFPFVMFAADRGNAGQAGTGLAAAGQTTGPAIAGFPDNWLARQFLSELGDLSPAEIKNLPSRIIGGIDGEPAVRFAIEEQGGAVYLLFLNERNLAFPQYGAGSYIVKLDGTDAHVIQIKIFLKDDPDCFIRIFPFGTRARMDLYLYEKRLYHDLPLPLTVETFLTESFRTIRDLTKNSIRWDLVLPENPGRGVKYVTEGAEEISAVLPGLKDADDGAMDETGRYVRISDGGELPEPGMNCSGFSKWITDSLYYPRAGRYLTIKELSVKYPDRRGNRWGGQFDPIRDPYFGLDWTRNCAVAMLRLDDPDADIETADIRSIPFFSYIEDVGYPAADIPLILYLLSVMEPGNIYLGAVNGDFGNEPSLRQYYHIAVFFPWLDSDGNLVIRVFERNVETPVEAFASRYKGEYIHLVRIRAGDFSFPPLP